MDNRWDFLKVLDVDCAYNVPLSKYTTFQVGGLVPCVVTCSSPASLRSTIQGFRKRSQPFLLIGYGSNILASDKGVALPVVRYVAETPTITQNGQDIEVAACTLLDSVARYTAEQGLVGLNFASGIPGTVGGAIVGNAGAFGKQIGDVLVAAEILSSEGTVNWVTKTELGFGYRHSKLKENGSIVISARLRLSESSAATLLAEREEILELRRAKHPAYLATPTAGSFFRNIEPTSSAGRRQAAGWFLEQAGAKDFRCGGAGVFDKHANILVKIQDCQAQDVYDLSVRMAQAVQEKFDLKLEREVVLLGEFDSAEYNPAKFMW